MRNNFHEIKAIISESKTFKECFYGVAEYIHGMMMDSRIKFKNDTLRTKLYFQAKVKENSIKFQNSNLHTTLILVPRPKENIIKISNEIKTKLTIILNPKNKNEVIFQDKAIPKTNLLFNPKINKNEFEIKNNEPKIDVALQGRTDNNKFVFKDKEDGTHSIVTLDSKLDKNNITVQNSTVNASTWNFLTLGDISGTLAEIEKSPLEYLGRKKIIQ